MAKTTLDRIDRRILEVLQREGRIANNELAARVSLSPAPCLRRVRALEEAGVIRGYAAQVDPAAIGLGLTAYASVKLEKKGRFSVDQFARAVHAWSEVVSCYAMTGEIDWLLRVQVADLDHYSRFVMDKLLKQPAVIDVKSNFVLDRVKETTALPLDRLP